MTPLSKRLRLILGLFALLLFAGRAKAGVVNSIPGGTVIPFSPDNIFTSGPVTVAPGITWSATNGGAVYGWTGGYGFNSNGLWDGLSMVATNDSTSSMTFAFSTPVAAVGGFVNWAPQTGTAVLDAYNSSNVLVDTTTLSFMTGGSQNSGQFWGFSDSSADISYFTLTGAYVGLTDLTVGNSQTPEPASLFLLGTGLLSIGLLSRRNT